MTPQQIKRQEELNKLQTKLHQDWLKHPVTVELVKILEARNTRQVQELQTGILTISDEKKEIGYRASIGAITAIREILINTTIFVRELNKLTPKE